MWSDLVCLWEGHFSRSRLDTLKKEKVEVVNSQVCRQYIPKSISIPSRLNFFKNETTEDMNVALLEEAPIIKLNKSFVASLSLLNKNE
jgi:hypothetical protein